MQLGLPLYLGRCGSLIVPHYCDLHGLVKDFSHHLYKLVLQ